MKLLDKLNNIEINQEGYYTPGNTVRIDGKMIEGVRNVKIEYGINTALPIITIELYANIKAKIKTAQGIYETSLEATKIEEK